MIAALKQPAGGTAARTQLLAEFLHTCSPDVSTRSMAATMFALTHWQVIGRAMSPLLPSMILVNAGDAFRDPLDAFADKHATGLGSKGAMDKGFGTYLGGDPEKARSTMEQAFKTVTLVDSVQPKQPSDAGLRQLNENRFMDAKAAGYGQGRTAQYAHAWDDDFGWLTDVTDDIILRLDRSEDREAFRKDVMEAPGKLLNPYGLNRTLDRVPKILAVSGSLTSAEWDGALVRGMLRLGLPVFFLPHLSEEELKIRDEMAMIALSSTFPIAGRERPQPVVAAVSLPENDWYGHYEAILRRLLHHLPASYEFTVLRAVHELGEVCARIARLAAAPGSTIDEKSVLLMDLHRMALRGIVIGVASLAFHGLVGHSGALPMGDQKLLYFIRDKGTVKRRDIQRRFENFTAERLGRVLEGLVAEGLVQLDGHHVTAIPLGDYVQSLHARPEFPEPNYLCPALLGMGAL